MVSKKVVFTAEQVAYLNGLPAVQSATVNRIEYAQDFQDSCMERYADGASPVKMFREAGLGPEIIGYKRIERCIARWKAARAKAQEAAGTAQSEA